MTSPGGSRCAMNPLDHRHLKRSFLVRPGMGWEDQDDDDDDDDDDDGDDDDDDDDDGGGGDDESYLLRFWETTRRK